MNAVSIEAINAPCRMVCAEPKPFEVVVSNVGVVYSGYSSDEATAAYEKVKASSADIIGPEAGEDVTLTYKGEPVREYVGVLSDARAQAETYNKANPKGPRLCDCPGCRMRRAVAMAIFIKETERGAN